MLDVNNFIALKAYLQERKIIGDEFPVSIESLAGGVSNSVIKISYGEDRFVLKQALSRLKVSSEWVSDVERCNVEKRALHFLHKSIPGISPGLLYEDEKNFLFIMECAPESSVTWKSLLMKQHCDEQVARKVGGILGRFHEDTHGLPEARELFSNKKFFYQLRIEPFFEFLKWNHPGLDKQITKHCRDCLERESSLVIGDYSPKNILVHNENVIVIDFEVIHYGDTSFDLGFLTTHLLLKLIKFPLFRDRYYAVLRETIDAYFSHIRFIERTELEHLAVRQLAWIMLARVDGKSPAEYITDEKEKSIIRFAGYEIISSNLKTYQEVVELFNSKIKQN